MLTHTFIVTDLQSGLRLDLFLAEALAELGSDPLTEQDTTEYSREKLKKAIKNGQCLVDGIIAKSPSLRLREGQSLTISLQSSAKGIEAQEGEVHTLWQDAHMLICNKPVGITVHPCPSCPTDTYIQHLASHFPILLEQDGLRPGIVHRLDKDTSGLLVIALHEKARLRLSEHFAERRVHKEYMALVQGKPPEHGEITEPIGRDPKAKIKMAIVPENQGGRHAHSTWQTLYTHPQELFSLVRICIHTGRTHQIRVHMAHLGFPLVGDTLYGAKKSTASRQMLHAWHIKVPHPISDTIQSFTCPPPEDMLNCAITLSKSMQKIIITGLPGCGKSALLKALEAKGLKIWSADAVVAKLYAPGHAGHAFLASRFHDRFVPHKNADIDREALRQAMQEDPYLRQEIECAIHAMVQHDLHTFWESNKTEDFAVAEIPLYLENSWHKKEQSHIVGVQCAKKTRHERLKKYRQWSEEHCETLDSWQWDEEKKMSFCHTVIHNTQDLAHLEQEAEKIVIKLTQEKHAQEDELKKHLCNLWQGE